MLKSTMYRRTWLAAFLASVTAIACRTIHAESGPYLLNNPPVPSSAEVTNITIVFLVLWLCLMVSLATVENRDDRTGRAGKPD